MIGVGGHAQHSSVRRNSQRYAKWISRHLRRVGKPIVIGSLGDVSVIVVLESRCRHLEHVLAVIQQRGVFLSDNGIEDQQSSPTCNVVSATEDSSNPTTFYANFVGPGFSIDQSAQTEGSAAGGRIAEEMVVSVQYNARAVRISDTTAVNIVDRIRPGIGICNSVMFNFLLRNRVGRRT